MKLKSLWGACALAPFALVAQSNDVPAAGQSEHEQHAAGPDAAAGNPPMAGMHEHMRQMNAQMARIHATEDPAERERLMHEHMQSMQQHMQMMRSARGVEERLASMEQLLQQMLEHQRVEDEQNATSRRERNRSR